MAKDCNRMHGNVLYVADAHRIQIRSKNIYIPAQKDHENNSRETDNVFHDFSLVVYGVTSGAFK